MRIPKRGVPWEDTPVLDRRHTHTLILYRTLDNYSVVIVPTRRVVIIPAIRFRSDVRVSARLQPSPGHAPDQRAAEPGRRQRRVDGRRQRSRGRVAAPAAAPVHIAVAGHEPGDAEGPRAELHAHTQGRTGTGRVPAVPVQRGLPLRALRLPGTPDALPLHAPGLRLQFLRQDPVRAAHGQAREVTEYIIANTYVPPILLYGGTPRDIPEMAPPRVGGGRIERRT